jgi:hypothetical protein
MTLVNALTEMQKVKIKMHSDRAKIKKICVLSCHFVPDLIRDDL